MGCRISDDNKLWPGGVVPFTINNADFPIGSANRQIIQQAINDWNQNTIIQLVPRNGQADFINFQTAAASCGSPVGRQSGQQEISCTVGTGFGTGNIIHEIGHAIGLWHEHTREDRDLFVTISTDNILPGQEHNFAQRIDDGDDVYGYDYGSILHYRRGAFSSSGDTITPTNPSAQIGQRIALSVIDVRTIGLMYSRPRRVINDLAHDAGGWRVDQHPRFLADITGDGRADIVGFGGSGVFTAISRGDGTFDPPRKVINDLAHDAGGWRVDQHPRFLADITGNGRADIVGFGGSGVFTAISRGDGTFDPPRKVINDLAHDAGGWRVDQHPRFLADITGDGSADIVGFGGRGVFVAISRGDGTFDPPRRVINNFAHDAGGWRVDQHPRYLADITGDGRADIVGFGGRGVFTATSRGDGIFHG